MEVLQALHESTKLADLTWTFAIPCEAGQVGSSLRPAARQANEALTSPA